MTRTAALAVAALLAGCGGSECPEFPESACRFEVRGACVMFDPTDPPLVDGIDVAAQIERGIADGAAFWGADPDAVVSGVTIVLVEHAFPADGSLAVGCAYPECRIVRLANGRAPSGRDVPGCPRTACRTRSGTSSVGDGAHTDPRWPSATNLYAGGCYQAADLSSVNANKTSYGFRQAAPSSSPTSMRVLSLLEER